MNTDYGYIPLGKIKNERCTDGVINSELWFKWLKYDNENYKNYEKN